MIAKLLLPASLVVAALAFEPKAATQEPPPAMTSHQDLLAFFREWREFQKPVAVAGVPDYTAGAMAKQRAALAETWLPRLAALKPETWALADRNDYRIVEAELF